jgi:sigma-B regulation protein RsbU (phosphoserine phosphatase)
VDSSVEPTAGQAQSQNLMQADEAMWNRAVFVIAEDEVVSRTLLRRQLEKAGYRVFEAPNGLEALKLVEKHKPDLLLSDWMMPEMDGVELCRQVKENPETSNTYILILTSREDKDDLVRALDAGADDYLRKPWDVNELLARIRAGLRVVKLQRSLALRNEDLGLMTYRLNQEIATVANIQKVLLPQEIPHTSALDVMAWYLPSSECGGDYYDVLQLTPEHQGFLVADVSGHGAPAMVTMALLRQYVHLVARDYDDPGALLEAINRHLFDHLPTDQFVTMFYAIIQTSSLECHYASAGHNPPLWFQNRKQETMRLQGCRGFPLKLVTREAQYVSQKIRLEAGDRLVLYTDGIPECFNPQKQDYGMERFLNVVNLNAGKCTPNQLETLVVTDVMRFSDDQLPEDDLTLMIIGVNEPAEPFLE